MIDKEEEKNKELNKNIYLNISLKIILIIIISFLLLKLYINYKIKRYRYYKNKIIRILPKTVQNKLIINIWYKDREDFNIIFHPYFFEKKRRKFNDIILNKILNKNFTYYKLWLINYNSKSLNFNEKRDKIEVLVKDKNKKNKKLLKIYNIPLLPILNNIKKTKLDYVPILTFLIKDKNIPKGYMKPYLIAFPDNIKDKSIEKINIYLNNKKIELKKSKCLKKYLEEFLERPTNKFWKNNNNSKKYFDKLRDKKDKSHK